MNREILFESFKSNLRGMSLEEFAGLFINYPQAVEEFYKLCHGINCGKTISLLFNPHRLSTDTVVNDMSVYESLQVDRLLSGLARLYMYTLERGMNDAFYNTIQRGYQNVQYVNEFPPFIARQIYETFRKDDGTLKVLDPCCGWGGRMIGCASLENTFYVGTEPCTKTFKGLLKLGNWLKQLQPTFDFSIHKLPYEDAKELGSDFDIALTSPPYYDVEHYSDEDTNSLNRYHTYEAWLDGFFEPLVLRTMKYLKEDGVFILNIGDRKYQLSTALVDICEKHNLHCERITDYLAGNGQNKEKFYMISRTKIGVKNKKLF